MVYFILIVLIYYIIITDGQSTIILQVSRLLSPIIITDQVALVLNFNITLVTSVYHREISH